MRRFAVVVLAAIPLHGQWLNYKTPGIPRLPDGKPNLSAPAPHYSDGKPDLSGLWRPDTESFAATGKAMDAIKVQPWAAAAYQKNKLNYGSDNPGPLCLPLGPQVDANIGRIAQTPNILFMLTGGTSYREVFLDGRDLPKDPNPTWMGYSVGRWDGQTLVVTSAGFNDRTWLDGDGHPHTEALHVTERIRRPDFGHLEIVKTLEDPGALLEPLTVPVKFELDADTEPLEYVCNENERDHGHLIGKTTDEKSVPVSLELLSKYAGDYEMKAPGTEQLLHFTFSVSGDHLTLTGLGPATVLTALSDTEFSFVGATVKFVPNDSGAVSYAIISIVEGDFKATRK